MLGDVFATGSQPIDKFLSHGYFGVMCVDLNKLDKAAWNSLNQLRFTSVRLSVKLNSLDACVCVYSPLPLHPSAEIAPPAPLWRHPRDLGCTTVPNT